MSTYLDAARLISSESLRAAILAFRGDISTFDVETEPDRELLALVDEPFESVPDAEDRLTRLDQRLRNHGDRRAVFLSIYVRMTEEVREGLAKERFANADWMRSYLVTFANYYRRAFRDYERGEFRAVPDPWRIAFGTALRGDGLVAQDAFLGVNAHINYDLGLTIRDVGIATNRAEKYADHNAINDILADLVDAQQEMLAERYASGLDEVDAALGRLDEVFTLVSMTEGREQAWRIAVVLTDVHWSPVTTTTRWLLRVTATGGALFILSPNLDPTLVEALRQVETNRFDLDDLLDTFHQRIDKDG